MVSFRKASSNKSDTRNLLTPKKSGFFGARKPPRSDETQSLSKRIFKKTTQEPYTPPLSPDSEESPLNVMVVTTSGSSPKPSSTPSRENSDGTYSVSGTTISDLSNSVIQQQQRYTYFSAPVEVPFQEDDDTEPERDLDPPSSVANSRAAGNHAESTLGETTTEATPKTTSVDGATDSSVFTSDPAVVMTSLLSAFDDACSPYGLTDKGKSATTELDNSLEMHADDDNVNVRPDASNVGVSGNAEPAWGLPPSEDDEEEEEQEEEEEDEASYTNGEEIRDPPSLSEDRAKEPHENFELVLDEDALRRTARKRFGWMRKVSRKHQTKEEKEATYRAVFGTEPAKDTAAAKGGTATTTTKTRKSSIVKRFSQALNRIPEEGSDTQKKSSSEESKAVTVDVDSLLGDEVVEEKPRQVKEETVIKEETKVEEAVLEEKQESKTVDKEEEARKRAEAEKILDDIKKATSLSDSPTRQRSWTFSGLYRKTWGDTKSKGEKVDMARSRSSPAGPDESNKPPKPIWKEVTDPNTGRPYYYHRFTRQTTWTKPEGFDDQLKPKPKPVESIPPEKKASFGRAGSFGGKRSKPKEDDAGKKGDKLWTENEAVSSVLRSKSPKEPSIVAKRVEIRNLLISMSPPDPASVDKLIEQYAGREDELLLQLRDLVQSQPFDEPLKKASSFGSSDWSPADGEAESGEGQDLVENLPVVKNNSITNRTRTTNTDHTIKSSRTDRTQKISNVNNTGTTASVNTSFTSDPAPDTAPVLASKEDGDEEKDGSRQKVPRNRELRVEEYTSSRYGLRAEKFSGTVVHQSGRRTPKPNQAPYQYSSDRDVESDSMYMGDEEPGISYESDSVSALSTPDADFANRKEKFEASRRKTLDDAIRMKDWDLAAIVTDDMRQSFDASDGSSGLDKYSKFSGGQFYEWTQSELDRFISENDWDAVAKYIAHMRDRNAREAKKASSSSSASVSKGRKASSDRRSGPEDSPRKSIGARSQLQHSRLQTTSWEESESSYVHTDDYSSETSLSSYERLYRRRKLQSFSC